MQEKKRNFSISKIVMTFAAVFVMTLAVGVPAKAANTPATVTGLRQTEVVGTDFVEVEWTALLENGTDYEAWISTSATGNYVPKKETTYGNSTTIYDLNAGTTYYVKIRAYVKDANSQKVYGGFSSPLEVVTRPNSKVSNLKHTKSTTSSISLSWKSVPGANCYAVSYKKSSQSIQDEKVKYATGTSITLSKLSKNETYSVFVYPARKTRDGKTIAVGSQWAYIYGISVTPGKVSGLSCPYYFKSSAEIHMRCNSNKAADGYQWELYTSYKKKDTKIKTVYSNAGSAYIKHSALKKHNFYKVRVRAYAVTSTGKKYYGTWSDWKYISPQPDIEKMKSTSSGIQINWDKIAGADRYVVYVSTKQQTGYKKYCTTTKTSTTVKKCGSSKLKSGKKYYVYVVAQNKVKGKYYTGDKRYCWGMIYRK